jgi:hypothetical protein
MPTNMLPQNTQRSIASSTPIPISPNQPPVIPAALKGVQVHWLDDLTPETLTYKALLDLRPPVVRTPLAYDSVYASGTANWTWYDRLIAIVCGYGGEVILVTPDYLTPYRTEESLQDPKLFDFVQGAAGRYATYKVLWELGNEPNAHVGPNQPVSIAAYMTYLTRMSQTLRSVSSQTLISAGLSGTDLPYLTSMRDAGLAKLVDAIGIHPYGTSDLAGAINALQSIENSLPYYFTEYGVDNADDAAYQQSLQSYLAQSSSPISIWYSLYGDDGFSLVTSNGAYRPAFEVFKDYNRAACVARYSLGSARRSPDGVALALSPTSQCGANLASGSGSSSQTGNLVHPAPPSSDAGTRVGQ